MEVRTTDVRGPGHLPGNTRVYFAGGKTRDFGSGVKVFLYGALRVEGRT